MLIRSCHFPILQTSARTSTSYFSVVPNTIGPDLASIVEFNTTINMTVKDTQYVYVQARDIYGNNLVETGHFANFELDISPPISGEESRCGGDYCTGSKYYFEEPNTVTKGKF